MSPVLGAAESYWFTLTHPLGPIPGNLGGGGKETLMEVQVSREEYKPV